jgi:Fe-Mn family superoxide dismutase
MTHTLPELNYGFDALEPFIDAKTMEIHHDKHHAGYVKKLNAALEGTGLESKPVEELLADVSALPSDKKQAIINNGGGHANHSFFWPTLKKGVEAKGEVVKAISSKWGSIDKFKEEFADAASGVFGSGWAWLVVGDKELEIIQTKNQDSPISQGKKPVLGLDVWEHAYYVKYFWNRGAYIEAFWNVVNWEQINENYLKAKA